MIIGLFQIQNHDTVLADGTAEGGICESLTIDSEAVFQIEEVIRAINKVGFDRYNESNEVEIVISWVFTGITAAADAAIRMRQQTDHVGALKISLTEDGETIYTATSAGALWRTTRPRLKGVSVTCTYQVTALNDFTVVNAPAGDGPFDFGSFPVTPEGSFDGGNYADGLVFFASVDGGAF